MDPYLAFFIMAFCIVGSVYTSYRQGLRQGAEMTLMVLEDMCLIEVDEDGNISN